MVKNPNWQEANQLAIYKRDRGVELGTTEKQLQIAVRAGLEPGTSGFQVRRPNHWTTLTTPPPPSLVGRRSPPSPVSSTPSAVPVLSSRSTSHPTKMFPSESHSIQYAFLHIPRIPSFPVTTCSVKSYSNTPNR